VLAAAIEAEGIEVSDDEVLDALRAAAAGEGGAPPSERKLQRSFDRLRQSGRDQDLREDIAMRKALDGMVESATPISVGQAKARDKLWTPEKEREEAGSAALWTPGS
jgi:trigger factor